MKKLSIFVDESGDFGAYSSHSPYYIVTMVFHDQSEDLSELIKKLDRELEQIGYKNPIQIFYFPQKGIYQYISIRSQNGKRNI